jgi:hypothetical protein
VKDSTFDLIVVVPRGDACDTQDPGASMTIGPNEWFVAVVPSHALLVLERFNTLT